MTRTKIRPSMGHASELCVLGSNIVNNMMKKKGVSFDVVSAE